ncbi:putative metalloreductase [Saccharomycopsis crataegensis]|uniref:Probable metalloreductase AIM14 n=1 Tax=Saccharomycopsis crataegensis TaxID=43959 RepID=A0AAV5QS40_9ASCO|nr:putative metalloreductase [Saccharomycopsis crataegensis]
MTGKNLVSSVLDPLISKRHGDHHHESNGYFGRAVVLLSVVNVIAIGCLNYLNSKYSYNPVLRGKKIAKLSRWLSSLPLFWKVIIWSVILTVLSFLPIFIVEQMTRELWIAVFRIMGKVAFAMFPFNVFLAIKPNPLPRTFYLTLLPLHKWLSRVIVIFCTVHALGYFYKWASEQKMTKLFKLVNIFGLVTWIGFLLTTVVSLKPFRRRAYDFFYSIHTITAWVSLGLLYFHARRQSNSSTFLPVALLVYSVFCKVWFTKLVKFTVKEHGGSDLMLVSFPASDYFKKTSEDEDKLSIKRFTPGSHVRISKSLKNWKSWVFSTHPYTIASIPSDKTVDFVIRKTKFQINDVDNYAISKSFPAFHRNFFRDADTIVIICGGSGISFGLPIYRYFMMKKQNLDGHRTEELDSGSMPTNIDVRMIWVIRNESDLFVLKEYGILTEDGKVASDHISNLSIFLTSGNKETVSSPAPESSNSASAFNKVAGLVRNSLSKLTNNDTANNDVAAYQQLSNDVNDSRTKNIFELDTLQSPGTHSSSKFTGKTSDDSQFEISFSDDEQEPASAVRSSTLETSISISSQKQTQTSLIRKGRPDLDECFEHLIISGDDDFLDSRSKWVVSCGPERLVEGCKDWARKNGIGHISEVYAM